MIDRSSKIRLFIDQELCLGLDITLSSAQAKYLFKVMRLNVGQFINVLDGKTGEYWAKICEKGTWTGKICVKKKYKDLTKPPDLWLLFSPLRKNRTEWIIEKATELGVQRIVPVIMARTNEIGFRRKRLRSIMIEALEQCGGTFLPDLVEPIKLDDCLRAWPSDRQLLFCDEKLSLENYKKFSAIKKRQSAGILIGPEGGFSDFEGDLIKQKKNVVQVSLGNRILRADTAAVAAISIWVNS